jgi:hypothetical protein
VRLEVVLALAAVIGLVGYLAACRWWPFAKCLRCAGSGQRRSTGMPFYIAGGALVLAGMATGATALGGLGALVVACGLFIRGGSFRNCPRCSGTGRRRRAGRRFVRPS